MCRSPVEPPLLLTGVPARVKRMPPERRLLGKVRDKIGVSACGVAQICNLLYRRFEIGTA